MHDPYRALYIHIPFCKERCYYCDFTTSARASDDPAIDDYVDGLIEQLHAYAKRGDFAGLKTAYIGGGTPTHIGNKRLTNLMYFLSIYLPMAQMEEITVEANPESLTPEMVKDLWSLGVNRLSIGVQSLDDGILNMMGRIHDAKRARYAITMARDRFENVSADVMCGIPGQTDAMLEDTIGQLLELGVTHISVYPLSVEQGSPLDKLIMHGKFPEPQEDVQAHHMELCRDALTDAGFVRYEVANYAKPGYESKHNASYWQGVPYIGVGKSAVTMTQNAERRMRMQDGKIVDDMEPREMLAEDLMLAMRMACGIETTRVDEAAKLLPNAPAVFDELERLGLTQRRDGRIIPTEHGWLCGNELFGRIWALAE